MRDRKFKKSRIPHKVFLVICEGESEEAYVNTLRQYYRLPVTIKTRVSGNTISHRLVNQYVKELGLNKNDDCQIFYIYDGDIECLAQKLLSLPGNTILTNPTFELWYLLHSMNYTKSCASEEILRLLMSVHPIWKNYSKGMLTKEQKANLISLSNDAISRSKKLKWPQNPSSNMHEFIHALEREKLS